MARSKRVQPKKVQPHVRLSKPQLLTLMDIDDHYVGDYTYRWSMVTLRPLERRGLIEPLPDKHVIPKPGAAREKFLYERTHLTSFGRACLDLSRFVWDTDHWGDE